MIGGADGGLLDGFAGGDLDTWTFYLPFENITNQWTLFNLVAATGATKNKQSWKRPILKHFLSVSGQRRWVPGELVLASPIFSETQRNAAQHSIVCFGRAAKTRDCIYMQTFIWFSYEFGRLTLSLFMQLVWMIDSEPLPLPVFFPHKIDFKNFKDSKWVLLCVALLGEIHMFKNILWICWSANVPQTSLFTQPLLILFAEWWCHWSTGVVLYSHWICISLV